MSTISLDLTALRPRVTSQIVLGLKAAMRIVLLWRERMRYRNELAQLSERDLQDFGVSRSTAKFEMSRRFWSA
jgi:uncharacterized protein YjiS (DUF1127 family)